MSDPAKRMSPAEAADWVGMSIDQLRAHVGDLNGHGEQWQSEFERKVRALYERRQRERGVA